MKTILTSIAAGSLLAALALAQPLPRYTVTDLGTLGGAGTNSNAFKLNSTGWVAGNATLISGGPQHAFLWYGAGGLKDIGTLGGPACPTCNSAADGINASGQAAVGSETAQADPNGEDFCGFGTHSQCLGALWKNGALTALSTLPGGHNANALDLNNAGQVIGFAENGVSDPTCAANAPFQVLRFEAVIWGPNGQIQELSPLAGDTVGFATGINDNGQAVGSSGLCANTASPSQIPAAPHAVLWDSDGAPTDLGHLQGTPAGIYNVATSINNLGAVVGFACVGPSTNPATCTEDGFLWTKETGMQDLGGLPGAIATGPPCCHTINNSGQIVGVSIDANFNETAVVWQGKVPVDLNTLIPANSGWDLQCAQSINDAGEISGFGTINGAVHAFVATPITHYTITDLGTFGGTSADAYGINSGGRIAGAAALANGSQRAFISGIGGTKYDLGTLGGPNSEASGPNDSVALAILAETSKKDPLGNDFCGFGTNLICLPAVWNGTMTPLPTLGGNNGEALAINNQGQVAGFAENSTKDPTCAPPQVLDYEAVLWGPNPGQVQELPPLPGDTVGFTFALNNNGQVVGSSGTCANTPLLPFNYGPHAVLWENGTATALGNLGGTMLGVGAAINDFGVVVGGSDLPSELPGFPFVQVHLTMWTPAGPQDLGTVGKDFSTLPTWINNNGQVIGASCDDMGNCRAFLWQNNVMTDLNTLIPANSPLYLAFAGAINDAGEIVGMAIRTSTGDAHAFLATPSKASAATASFEPVEQRVTTPMALPESARKLLRHRLWMGRQ